MPSRQLLTAWAEPWAAFGRAIGLADERPALDRAWRALLQNQAHDSIGGCSIDPVHERMAARYDDADGLGRATVTRVLERLGGRKVTRETPWRDRQDVVVFNASAETRTDVVRVPFEGFPPWRMSVSRFDMHPLAMPAFGGLTVDGARCGSWRATTRRGCDSCPVRGGLDVELVARDVPAFGCRRYSLVPAGPAPDDIDTDRTIEAGDIRVRAARRRHAVVHDRRGAPTTACSGSRTPSTAATPTTPTPIHRAPSAVTTDVQRTRHASGIARLRVARALAGIGTLTVEAVVAPGVPFVRCEVSLDNRAEDHRLRLRFPTSAPIDEVRVATTFDIARRTSTAVDDSQWVHRAPRTFVHQGWIAANGLTVGAPGLPEAEVTPAGDILVTLVRSVGALARLELRTRPCRPARRWSRPARRCRASSAPTVTLAATPSDARAAEIGMWGVLGDDTPLLDDGVSLLELDARASLLSACKPAADGDGIVVRVLNPGDAPDEVVLRFGFDVADATAVRLDETPDGNHLTLVDRTVTLTVPPHALRSVRVHTLRR